MIPEYYKYYREFDGTIRRCPGCGRDLPNTPDFFYRVRKGEQIVAQICCWCQDIRRYLQEHKMNFSRPTLPEGYRECTWCLNILEVNHQNFPITGKPTICRDCWNAICRNQRHKRKAKQALCHSQ